MSQSVPRAVAWSTGTLASFMSMAISGRELSSELSVFQMVFFRNAICLAIIVVLMARLGWHLARTARPGRHVARNTVHFAAQYGWLLGVASIPLAEVFAIEFTTPIWTAILASIFLGERLTLLHAAGGLLVITGIAVPARPGRAGPDQVIAASRSSA